MNILLFLLIFGVYGVSNIIVYGSIFEKFRTAMFKVSKFLGTLFSCMMCTSFWVGVLISYGLLSLIGFSFSWLLIPILIFLGGFFSGTTWIIHTIQESFEK